MRIDVIGGIAERGAQRASVCNGVPDCPERIQADRSERSRGRLFGVDDIGPAGEGGGGVSSISDADQQLHPEPATLIG